MTAKGKKRPKRKAARGSTRPYSDESKAKGSPAVQPPTPVRGASLGLAREPDLPTPAFPEIAEPKKRAYLVGYARSGRLADGAAAAGVDLRTGYNWRHDQSDPAFQEGMRIARGLAGDRLEAEVIRRAVEGVEKPVYQQGRLVGTVREFSDLLLIFATKGALPEKYRERFEHSGPGGGPIRTDNAPDLSHHTVEELRTLHAIAKAAAARAAAQAEVVARRK